MGFCTAVFCPGLAYESAEQKTQRLLNLRLPKVCIKSPCTSISASSAVLTVHGLLIQTLSALIIYHNLHLLQGSDVGDCTTDTFSITAPGNVGSPVICGFNTGQHSETLEKYTGWGWRISYRKWDNGPNMPLWPVASAASLAHYAISYATFCFCILTR